MESEVKLSKVCTKCGEEKELSEFHKSPASRGGFLHRCKSCVSEYNKVNYLLNTERYKCESLKYRNENKFIINEKGRIYYRKILGTDRAKYLESKRTWKKNNKIKTSQNARSDRKNLINNYIKTCISREFKQYGIKRSDITPEWIETKRTAIKYKRQYQTLKNQING